MYTHCIYIYVYPHIYIYIYIYVRCYIDIRMVFFTVSPSSQCSMSEQPSKVQCSLVVSKMNVDGFWSSSMDI